jgi:hypothetical protein
VRPSAACGHSCGDRLRRVILEHRPRLIGALAHREPGISLAAV